MLMRKMLAVWLVVVTVAIAGAAAQSTPGGCKAIDSIILCNPGEFTCFGADIDGIQDDLVKNDCVMCPATTYRNNNTGGCCFSCIDPTVGNNATGVIPLPLPTTPMASCSEWRNILNSRCYCPQNFVFSAWIPIDSENNGVTAKCAQCPSGYVAPEGNTIERDVPSTSTIAFSACLNAAIDDAKCELLNGCARCKANYEWAGPAGASECRCKHRVVFARAPAGLTVACVMMYHSHTVDKVHCQQCQQQYVLVSLFCCCFCNVADLSRAQ